MSRAAVWLRLFLVWLPIWGLYALLIGPANPLHPAIPGPTLLPSLQTIRLMDLDYVEVARRLPTMDAAVRNIFGL